MAAVQLMDIAIARSGDKGSGTNIGLTANTPQLYEFLVDQLTAAVVKDFFSKICMGEVIRYELPNLKSLNFILKNSLGGGGTETMVTDAQGKVHGLGLLHLKMEIPDELLTGETG
ncbi:MAG: hypothetical protein WD005_03690 [Haliea sp.]